MKLTFPAVWLSICLLTTFQTTCVVAAVAQEKPDSSATVQKNQPDKKAAPVKKKPAVKRRAPIATKSKSASDVVKTQLPSATLDLSLPKGMVEELKPEGSVPMSRRDALLPQMFGDKAGSSPFQLNGRLLSNEMQLQMRSDDRRDVEGALLEFEFKQ